MEYSCRIIDICGIRRMSVHKYLLSNTVQNPSLYPGAYDNSTEEGKKHF
jgi:hypothetical protein